MTPLPSTGLHPNVSFEDYRSWDAVNISSLKPMADTPLHCRWEKDHPRESDEMAVGSAAHVSILEPGRLDREFYFSEVEYKLNTKEGKATHAEELVKAGNRKYIRRMAGEAKVDGDDVKGMAECVRQNSMARTLLDKNGQCEVSALWRDPITGLMCKGRFDKLITGTRSLILELKTCQSARAWDFGKACSNFGYHAQAAWYRWGCKELTGAAPNHAFIAVENKGPWATAVYTLDDASMNLGAVAFRAWLDRYAECLKSGKWPGYPEKCEEIALPDWAN